MNINNENIEEYIIDLIDGELDKASAEKVLAYINEHPEYEALLKEYQDTIFNIAEDDDEGFVDKSSLYKEVSVKHLIPYKKILYTSAAAVLLIGFGFNMMNNQTSDQQTPKSMIAQQKPAVQSTPNIKSENEENDVEVAKNPNSTSNSNSRILIASIQPISEKELSKNTDIKKDDWLAVEKLEGQSIRKVDYNLNTSFDYKAEIEIPKYAVTKTENNLNKFLDINIPVLEIIQNESKDIIEKINTAKNIIQHTSIVAQIGNKQIKIK